MKKLMLIASFAVYALLAAVGLAQQSEWTPSVSTTVVSRYIGGTGGALFTNKPCLQTNFNLVHRSGFYFNFWRSIPLNPDYSNTFANETDWALGYNTNIARGQLNLDVSAWIYDLVPTSDLYALNCTLSTTKGPVKAYGVLEHDFTGGDDLPAGTIYKIGLRGGVNRSPLCWDVAFLGNCGHKPFGGRADVLSGGRFQLDYPLQLKKGTLSLGFIYYKPMGHCDGLVSNQMVYRAQYDFRF